MNLDANLFPLNSPITDGSLPPSLIPWEYGVNQTIQTRRIKASQANFKNFIILSTQASSTGTIGNGTTLLLQTRLTPNIPHQAEINFAIPFVSVYQGTVANSAFQVYPNIGGSITPGQYTVNGNMDWHAFAATTPGSVISVWSGYITDNSAGNQTILFVTQWKFTQYNSGTVT